MVENQAMTVEEFGANLQDPNMCVQDKLGLPRSASLEDIYNRISECITYFTTQLDGIVARDVATGWVLQLEKIRADIQTTESEIRIAESQIKVRQVPQQQMESWLSESFEQPLSQRPSSKQVRTIKNRILDVYLPPLERLGLDPNRIYSVEQIQQQHRRLIREFSKEVTTEAPYARGMNRADRLLIQEELDEALKEALRTAQPKETLLKAYEKPVGDIETLKLIALNKRRRLIARVTENSPTPNTQRARPFALKNAQGAPISARTTVSNAAPQARGTTRPVSAETGAGAGNNPAVTNPSSRPATSTSASSSRAVAQPPHTGSAKVSVEQFYANLNNPRMSVRSKLLLPPEATLEQAYTQINRFLKFFESEEGLRIPEDMRTNAVRQLNLLSGNLRGGKISLESVIPSTGHDIVSVPPVENVANAREMVVRENATRAPATAVEDGASRQPVSDRPMGSYRKDEGPRIREASSGKGSAGKKKMSVEEFRANLNNPDLTIQQKLQLPQGATTKQIYAKIELYRRTFTKGEGAKLPDEVKKEIIRHLDEMKKSLQTCEKNVTATNKALTQARAAHKKLKTSLDKSFEKPTSTQIKAARAAFSGKARNPFKRLGLDPKGVYSAEQIQVYSERLLQQFPLDTKTNTPYSKGLSAAERKKIRAGIEKARDAALKKASPREVMLAEGAERLRVAEQAYQNAIAERKKLIGRITKEPGSSAATSGARAGTKVTTESLVTETVPTRRVATSSAPVETPVVPEEVAKPVTGARAPVSAPAEASVAPKGVTEPVVEGRAAITPVPTTASQPATIEERYAQWEAQKRANDIALEENGQKWSEARQRAIEIYAEKMRKETDLRILQKHSPNLLTPAERARLGKLPQEIAALEATYQEASAKVQALGEQNHSLWQEYYALENQRLEIRQAEIVESEIRSGKRAMPLNRQYEQVNRLYEANTKLIEHNNALLMTERHQMRQNLENIRQLEAERLTLIGKQRTGSISAKEVTRLNGIPEQIQLLEQANKTSLAKISELEGTCDRLWAERAKFNARYGEVWQQVARENAGNITERTMSLAEQRAQITQQTHWASRARSMNTAELQIARQQQTDLFVEQCTLEAKQRSLLEQQRLGHTLSNAEKIQLESLPSRIAELQAARESLTRSVEKLQARDKSLWQEERALNEHTREVRATEIRDSGTQASAPREGSAPGEQASGTGEAATAEASSAATKEARLQEIAAQQAELTQTINRNKAEIRKLVSRRESLNNEVIRLIETQADRKLTLQEELRIGEAEREINQLLAQEKRLQLEGQKYVRELKRLNVESANLGGVAQVSTDTAVPEPVRRGNTPSGSRTMRNTRAGFRSIKLSNGITVRVAQGPLSNALVENKWILSNAYVAPTGKVSGVMANLGKGLGAVGRVGGAALGTWMIMDTTKRLAYDRSLSETEKGILAVKTAGYFTPAMPVLMGWDMGMLHHEITHKVYSVEEAQQIYLDFMKKYGDVFARPEQEQTADLQAENSEKTNQTSPRNPIIRRFLTDMANTVTGENRNHEGFIGQTWNYFTGDAPDEFYALCDEIKKNPNHYFNIGVRSQNLFMTMLAASEAQKGLDQAAQNQNGTGAENLDKYRLDTEGLIKVAIKNNDVETLYYLLSGMGTKFEAKDISDILRLPRTLLDSGEDLGEVALVAAMGQMSAADLDSCINTALHSVQAIKDRGVVSCLTPTRFELILSQYHVDNKMSAQTCIHILEELRQNPASAPLADILYANGFDNIEITPEVIQTIDKLPNRYRDSFVQALRKTEAVQSNPELLGAIKPLDALSRGEQVNAEAQAEDSAEQRRSPLTYGHIDKTNPHYVETHSQMFEEGINPEKLGVLGQHEFVLEERVYLNDGRNLQLVYKNEEDYRHHRPSSVYLCDPKKVRPQNDLFYTTYGMRDLSESKKLQTVEHPSVKDYVVWDDKKGWCLTDLGQKTVGKSTKIVEDSSRYQNIVVKTQETTYSDDNVLFGFRLGQPEVADIRDRDSSRWHRSTAGVSDKDIKVVQTGLYTTYEYPQSYVISPLTKSSERYYETFMYDENHQRVNAEYQRVPYESSAQAVKYETKDGKVTRKLLDSSYHKPMHQDWAREEQLKRMAADKENAFYGAIMANDYGAQDYLLRLDPTLIHRPLTYLSQGEKKTGTVLEILGEHALNTGLKITPEQLFLMRAAVRNAPNRDEYVSAFVGKMSAQNRSTTDLINLINAPAYNLLKSGMAIPTNKELIAEVTSAEQAQKCGRDMMLDYLSQSWKDVNFVDSVKGATMVTFLRDITEKYPELKEDITSLIPADYLYKKELSSVFHIEPVPITENSQTNAGNSEITENTDETLIWDNLEEKDFAEITAKVGNSQLSVYEQLGLTDLATAEDVSRRARTLLAYYETGIDGLSNDDRQTKVKAVCAARDAVLAQYRKDVLKSLAFTDELAQATLEAMPEPPRLPDPEFDASFIGEGIDLSDRARETVQLLPPLEPKEPEPEPTKAPEPTVAPYRVVTLNKDTLIEGDDWHQYKDEDIYRLAEERLTKGTYIRGRRRVRYKGKKLTTMLGHVTTMENNNLLPTGKDGRSNAYIYLYKLQQLNLLTSAKDKITVKDPETGKTKKVTLMEYLCGNRKDLTPEKIEKLLQKEKLSPEELEAISDILLRIENVISDKGHCLLSVVGIRRNASFRTTRGKGFTEESEEDSIEHDTVEVILHGTEAEQQQQLREWEAKGYTLQTRLKAAEEAAAEAVPVEQTGISTSMQQENSNLRGRLRTLSGENPEDVSGETLVHQSQHKVNV